MYGVETFDLTAEQICNLLENIDAEKSMPRLLVITLTRIVLIYCNIKVLLIATCIFNRTRLLTCMTLSRLVATY